MSKGKVKDIAKSPEFWAEVGRYFYPLTFVEFFSLINSIRRRSELWGYAL